MKIDLDPETFRVLSEIALVCNRSPEEMLKKLAEKYRAADTWQKSLIVTFLR